MLISGEDAQANKNTHVSNTQVMIITHKDLLIVYKLIKPF